MQLLTLTNSSPEGSVEYMLAKSANAVVTCEIKLFQNYFSLHRRPSEIVLPEIISKLFQRFVAAHEYSPTCSVSLK